MKDAADAVGGMLGCCPTLTPHVTASHSKDASGSESQ